MQTIQPSDTDATRGDQQKNDNARTNHQLAIQCDVNRVQAASYLDQMLAALKHQYKEDDDKTNITYTHQGQNQQIHGSVKPEPDIKFTSIMADGKPVAVNVEVNPASCLVNGVFNKDKQIDMAASAGAKLMVAQASAKYPGEPQKGLAELRSMTMFWSGGTDKEQAQLNKKTVIYIAKLLAKQTNTAGHQAQANNQVPSSAPAASAPTPAVESSASTAPTPMPTASAPTLSPTPTKAPALEVSAPAASAPTPVVESSASTASAPTPSPTPTKAPALEVSALTSSPKVTEALEKHGAAVTRDKAAINIIDATKHASNDAEKHTSTVGLKDS